MEIGDTFLYIYMYMARARQFSSVGPVLRYVGGVKHQVISKM